MPILTREQEQEYLDTFFSTDSTTKAVEDARNMLISSNLRFVFKRAKILSNGDTEQFIELISSGNEGLCVGLDKFDNTSGMRFLTYAGWWVFQRQMKAMSEFRLVALPTQKQQLSVKIRKFQDDLEIPPTIEHLIREFPDINEKDLRELSQTSFLTFYIDNMNEDEMPIIDGISTTEKEIMIDQMKDLIYSIGTRDSDLICRLYGLTDGGKKESYSQIMSVYPDVSRQYLKDLKSRALEMLTTAMNGENT
tara:strand:- start:337 stop:1086 length:750 start_codon:yes stop_codon:yes gene_type:complete